MPIVSCLVFDNKKKEIKYSYESKKNGVLDLVKERVLRTLGDENQKKTMSKEIYEVHIEVREFVTVVCVAVDTPKRSCWECIDEILDAYLKDDVSKFKSFMKTKMAYYSDPSNDKLTQAHNKVEAIKDEMLDNVEKIVSRDQVDTLSVAAADLQYDSNLFTKTARKKKMQSACVIS